MHVCAAGSTGRDARPMLNAGVSVAINAHWSSLGESAGEPH